jgi:two-component system, LytTR family, response regulator
MIVDDEAPAREGMRLRLKGEPDVVIVAEHGDPAKALAALAEDPPDVLFLDIQMPGIDGFGVIERTRGGPMPLIVFVTAHEEHAVRAFGVRAVDYLLKPVDPDRLRETMVRVREHLDRQRKGEIADRVRGILDELGAPATVTGPSSPRGVDRIPIRVDGEIRFVVVNDIDYVEAAGDAVRLHVGRVTHSLGKSMGEMLVMLDPRRFVRIHRSTIVNADRVHSLQPYFHGEYVVVLRDGTRLKLSRGYKSAVARLAGSR